MNDAPLRAIRPDDERLREYGFTIITRFLALVRIGRSYDVENQVFVQQLLSFIESLGPVFAEAPEAVGIVQRSMRDLFDATPRRARRATVSGE